MNAHHLSAVYLRNPYGALQAMQLLSDHQAPDVVRPAWARLVVPDLPARIPAPLARRAPRRVQCETSGVLPAAPGRAPGVQPGVPAPAPCPDAGREVEDAGRLEPGHRNAATISRPNNRTSSGSVRRPNAMTNPFTPSARFFSTRA